MTPSVSIPIPHSGWEKAPGTTARHLTVVSLFPGCSDEVLSVHRLELGKGTHRCGDNPGLVVEYCLCELPENICFPGGRGMLHNGFLFQLASLNDRAPGDEMDK